MRRQTSRRLGCSVQSTRLTNWIFQLVSSISRSQNNSSSHYNTTFVQANESCHNRHGFQVIFIFDSFLLRFWTNFEPFLDAELFFVFLRAVFAPSADAATDRGKNSDLQSFQSERFSKKPKRPGKSGFLFWVAKNHLQKWFRAAEENVSSKQKSGGYAAAFLAFHWRLGFPYGT